MRFAFENSYSPNYFRSGTLYVLDMLVKLPDEVRQEFKPEILLLTLHQEVLKVYQAPDTGISGLTRKPATMDER